MIVSNEEGRTEQKANSEHLPFDKLLLSDQSNKQEEKKEEKTTKHHEQHQLSCFEVPDMSKIWFDGSIQFKKEQFVDQFGQELTVEGEWLNGVPHGVCIVEN